jgi:DNA polymerase/3'-5' exonuclease PolX
MSTGTKRRHADALADAQAFSRLFWLAAYERWSFAGSLRRECPEVGDVEHVVMANTGPAETGALFTEHVNLLWHRLDQLVREGTVLKHLYPNNTVRWGEKYRGVNFRGHLHEIFLADQDNWGPTLAIRTGPAGFSRRLVIGLQKHGLRNKDGKVWRCQPCGWCDAPGADRGACRHCDGTGLLCLEAISVPDERQYLQLAGVGWVEPKNRKEE